MSFLLSSEVRSLFASERAKSDELQRHLSDVQRRLTEECSKSAELSRALDVAQKERLALQLALAASRDYSTRLEKELMREKGIGIENRLPEGYGEDE
jgi:uncharacterized membrane-anchored protein YhcB (DUF1043 family)